jgi:hypothetical protein
LLRSSERRIEMESCTLPIILRNLKKSQVPLPL